MKFSIAKIFLVTAMMSVGFAALAQDGSSSGSQMPPPPSGGPGGPGAPQLTDSQKTCLDGILGKPGTSTTKPSYDDVKAAFISCDIPAPARPPREPLTSGSLSGGSSKRASSAVGRH